MDSTVIMMSFLESSRFQKIVFAGITFLLAAIALFNPFTLSSGIQDVGVLLVWAAVLVFIQGFRRSSVQERNSAHWSAFITLLFGLLLINAELFVGNAVYVFAIFLLQVFKIRNRKINKIIQVMFYLFNVCFNTFDLLI